MIKNKILVGSDGGTYSFNASTGVITISGLGTNFELEDLLLVVNITSNKVYYNPLVSGEGATLSISGSDVIIDLDKDTSSDSNSDGLQIWIRASIPIDVSISDKVMTGNSLLPVVDLFSNSNSSFSSDDGSYINEYINASGGSYTWNSLDSSISLTVTTASGSRSVLEQHGYNTYTPGTNVRILATGAMNTHVSGNVKRIGIFDDNDGLFFERDASGIMNVVLRTSTSGSPVETRIPQSSWSIDRADGTGNSKFNANFNFAQMYIIEYQFEVGTIKFGVIHKSRIIWLHWIESGNVIAGPYMRRGTLPVRYENINTTGVPSGSTLKVMSYSVMSEKVSFETLFNNSVSNAVTGKSINSGVRNQLLSIRLKSTYNSTDNRGIVIPQEFTITTTSNASFYYELVLQRAHLSQLNLGGTPTWNSVGADSLCEFTVNGTTVTGGRVITSGYSNAQTRLEYKVLNSIRDYLSTNSSSTNSDGCI
jgi:hypothetical protein